MKCPECKHDMDEHSDDGCNHVTKGWDFCFCALGKGEIALLLLPKLARKIARLEKEIADLNEMILDEAR